MAANSQTMPPLRINSSLCLPLRYPKSSCRICVEGCPVSALKIREDTIDIDGNGCTGCGICSSLCPTGVFEMTNFKMPAFRPLSASSDSCEEKNVKEEQVVMVECFKVPLSSLPPDANTTSLLRLPCFGFASPSLLLGLIAAGIDKIVFRDACICEVCESKKGIEYLRSLFDSLSSLLEPICGKGRVLIESLPLKRDKLVYDGDRLKDYGRGVMTRREFFSFLRERSAEGISSLIHAEFSPNKGGMEDEEAGFKKRELERSLPEERVKLLQALQGISSNNLFLPSSVILEQKVQKFHRPSLFHKVHIDKGCSGCQLCTIFCPTGALFKTEDVEGIGFRLSRCASCGLCREVCPKKVIVYDFRVDIDRLLDDREETLILFDKDSCNICGTPFIKTQGDGGLCDRCRKDNLLTQCLPLPPSR